MKKSRDIVIDLELKLSLKETWDNWIENHKLEKWLTVKANVEPKLNGKYDSYSFPPQWLGKFETLGTCQKLAREGLARSF